MLSDAHAETGWAADVTPPEHRKKKEKKKGQMRARVRREVKKMHRVLKTMRTFSKDRKDTWGYELKLQLLE